MKKNNPKNISIILLASITLLIVVQYFWVYHNPSSPISQKNITMVSLATSTPYTITSGEYPQFNNVSKEFNQKIRDSIMKGVNEHRKSSEDNWKARYETALPTEHIGEFPSLDERFEYNASTTVVRDDSHILSVIINVYEFSGGAHGSHAILTFNYDHLKQKEITLDDFIADDPHFLDTLSKIARTRLATDLAAKAGIPKDQINKEMLYDGTSARIDNYRVFTLPTDTQITFYFTDYQIAPYVFGSSDITVELPPK